MKTLWKISMVGAVALAMTTIATPKAQAMVYVAGGDPAPVAVISPVVYPSNVVYAAPAGCHDWWRWHHRDRCRRW